MTVVKPGAETPQRKNEDHDRPQQRRLGLVCLFIRRYKAENTTLSGTLLWLCRLFTEAEAVRK
jgi:hypothetical protein